MEEIVEIILRAIDDASNVFSSVSGSAEEMGSAIEQSASEGTGGLDEMGSAAETMGETIGSSADTAAESIDNMETEANETADAINSMADLMAFEAISDVVGQLADKMWELADKAGTVQDSWTRVGLAAEGAGIPINDMKNSISSLATETGRAGSSIRESFISMSSAGVTELSAMEDVFRGASAQAFILGTDVESLTNKFAGMAMKSSIAERTLKGTGITVEELGQVLGIQGATIDDVNAKWATMDTNARAAALGQAAAMNEGKEANDAYKNSWEGLQAQIDIAKGKFETMVGSVLLPVLIPVLETAGRVLSWLGDTLSAVMSGPLGGFISVIVGAAAGLVLLVVAVAAVSAGMGFFTASLLPAIAASWALIAPWLPFIAIGAAVVFIIYEIGKAFGWWTDVGSMLDAIWSGLQRIWDAFINHPDVQAVIKAIGDAWNWVVSGIQWVIGAIMEFFGISTGGDFDIVRAIIDGIGFAWQIISIPLRLVISLTQALVGVFQWLWNVLSPLGEFLMSVLTPIWQATADILMQIIGYVMSVVEVFGQLLDGTANLGDVFNTVWGGLIDLISNVASVIWDTIVAVVTNVATSMLEFASNMLTWAIQAGWNFLTGIVTWLSQLPGRVYTFLVQVAQYIWTQTANWVKTAVQKANELVTGVINWIKQLPMKVYTFLIQVLTKIIDTGKQWVESIKQKAKELVDGAVNKVKELPGKIASSIKGVTEALVKPFRDAWNQIRPLLGLMGQAGNQTASGGDAWGTDMAWGSDELSYNVGSQEYKVTQTLVLDLQNVPATMSESTLVDLLSNKKVLQALTGNKDFQDFDMRMKKEIQNRSIRARGV